MGEAPLATLAFTSSVWEELGQMQAVLHQRTGVTASRAEIVQHALSLYNFALRQATPDGYLHLEPDQRDRPGLVLSIQVPGFPDASGGAP